MRKSTLSCIVVPLLPIGMSVFLFTNYVNTVNGGIRIQSEMGYYLFLIMVVVSSFIFAMMQKSPSSRKLALNNVLLVNVFLLVCVFLDMFFHILARELTHLSNSSPEMSGGFQQYMPLVQSAWRIYGVRFITVLILGNFTFWGITKLKQLRSR